MNDDGMVSVPLSWSERHEEVKAERDRLRAIVEDPDGAIEALHGRLDEAQSERVQLVAERDRLQADKAHLVEVNAALRTRPDLAERAPLVVALVKERDELKELADGYAARGDALVEERDRLQTKADEADVELTEFVNLVTPLLQGTANALKGEPGPLRMHDWSDLPKAAGNLVADRDRLRELLDYNDAGIMRRLDDAEAERDRLRGLLEAREDERDRLLVERDRLQESVARYKAFAESEILDRVSADLGVDLRRQLEEGT